MQDDLVPVKEAITGQGELGRLIQCPCEDRLTELPGGM